MKNKNLFLILVWTTSIVSSLYFIFIHKVNIHYKENIVISSVIDLKNPIKITKVDVIKGHEFDLTLQDGRVIHALLSIESIKDCKSKVVELFASSTDPKVVLLTKKDNNWVVQVYLTIKDDKNEEIEVSLNEWLKQKNLIYY